jgi:hypothetical protein
MGLEVYRTTYDDNEKWALFVEEFERLASDLVAGTEGREDHQQYLDFSIFSDHKFDKAPTAQLRADFLEWRLSDEAVKEQGLDPEGMSMEKRKFAPIQNCRYDHFGDVNAESFKSAQILGQNRSC